MVLACFLFSLTMLAQRKDPLEGKVFFGPGLGIDHGGIGLRLDVRATEYAGIFGGIGYALAGIGWNTGIHVRVLPKKPVCPYVTGMYGYNTAVKTLRWRGTYSDQVLYYGPSFGAGVELRKTHRSNYFRLGLIIPIRSDAVKQDYRDLVKDLWPVLITLGLHFPGS